MKTKTSLKKMQQEIESIQKQLLELGPMHPGSISLQYQVCGRPGCRCAHPTKPKRHGPYHKLFFVHRGKKACRFVRQDSVEVLNSRLAAYKQFRKLVDRWIELSILIGQIDFFSAGSSQNHRQK